MPGEVVSGDCLWLGLQRMMSVAEQQALITVKWPDRGIRCSGGPQHRRAEALQYIGIPDGAGAVEVVGRRIGGSADLPP